MPALHRHPLTIKCQQASYSRLVGPPGDKTSPTNGKVDPQLFMDAHHHRWDRYQPSVNKYAFRYTTNTELRRTLGLFLIIA